MSVGLNTGFNKNDDDNNINNNNKTLLLVGFYGCRQAD
jgi:hypothetical protein